ncbi:MAG: hypothetical protein LBS86_03100 [Treponema sp.]|jgi:hypothetical protein|nr:hypothetical protein [Treponema sp.]
MEDSEALLKRAGYSSEDASLCHVTPLVVSVFCMLIAAPVYTQERREDTYWGFATGLEYNGFTLQGGAGAWALTYSPIENRFAIVSLRMTLDSNFSTTVGGDFAWRFMLSIARFARFQLLGGVEQGILYASVTPGRDRWSMTLNGILSVKAFLGEHLFIELYGRGGYPVMYAVGLSIGLRYLYQ